jgi:hypothetical protein
MMSAIISAGKLKGPSRACRREAESWWETSLWRRAISATRTKALCNNPCLQVIGLPPVSPCSTDDLYLPVETIRNIRHRLLLMIDQDGPFFSAVTAEPGYPTGRRRRFLPLQRNSIPFTAPEMLGVVTRCAAWSGIEGINPVLSCALAANPSSEFDCPLENFNC